MILSYIIYCYLNDFSYQIVDYRLSRNVIDLVNSVNPETNPESLSSSALSFPLAQHQVDTHFTVIPKRFHTIFQLCDLSSTHNSLKEIVDATPFHEACNITRGSGWYDNTMFTLIRAAMHHILTQWCIGLGIDREKITNLLSFQFLTTGESGKLKQQKSKNKKRKKTLGRGFTLEKQLEKNSHSHSPAKIPQRKKKKTGTSQKEDKKKKGAKGQDFPSGSDSAFISSSLPPPPLLPLISPATKEAIELAARQASIAASLELNLFPSPSNNNNNNPSEEESKMPNPLPLKKQDSLSRKDFFTEQVQENDGEEEGEDEDDEQDSEEEEVA